MSEIARALVPSRRDALQALATRGKKTLAVAAVVATKEEATRADDAGVRAFAASGEAVAAAAEATRSVPVVALDAMTSVDDVRRARLRGADAVLLAVDASWPALAEAARSTHMQPFAIAGSEADLAEAARLGARAVVVDAPELAASAPRGMTLVLRSPGGDLEALRSRLGVVDAVLVGPEIHGHADFAALVGDVDG